MGGSALHLVDPLGLFPNSAQMACARNPALCAEIGNIPKPLPKPMVPPIPLPIPKNPPKDENCDQDDNHEKCIQQWISDTKWCDHNYIGRKNIACHAWAVEELTRCIKGSSRQPFRL